MGTDAVSTGAIDDYVHMNYPSTSERCDASNDGTNISSKSKSQTAQKSTNSISVTAFVKAKVNFILGSIDLAAQKTDVA
ncbi:hypothetical protein C7476_10255 [Phyllobacterium bourgognense]|uniref:Uncharacterized protein n=1 Tax=Phyllobacterium bourgognense TaxID=314236 RepID=A0A368Z2R3_9HYPH|nr:hypothetical protein C7476_10255 [Phyllobacterium bourgognense]